MKIVKLDVKNGLLKGVIKSYDDLVVLSYVIEASDVLTAFSKRKTAINGHPDIKTIKLSIEVEDSGLKENALSVSGKLSYSSDPAIPLHRYHTITLTFKKGFILRKNKFMNFQVGAIKRSKERSPKVAVLVYEEGYAIFYRMSEYAIRRLYEIKSGISGKRFKNESRKLFFEKLVKAILEEYEKTRWDVFIIAGKAMDNEILRPLIKDKDIHYDTVSYADTGMKELIRKGAIEALLKENSVIKQNELVNTYIGQISKNDPNYIYGINKILEALDSKKAEQALLSKEFILAHRQVLVKLDQQDADIIIIEKGSESSDILANFGGAIIKF